MNGHGTFLEKNRSNVQIVASRQDLLRIITFKYDWVTIIYCLEVSFFMFQLSVESIWASVGMMDPNQGGLASLDSGSDTSSPIDSPRTALPPSSPTQPPDKLLRSAALNGLDTH